MLPPGRMRSAFLVALLLLAVALGACREQAPSSLVTAPVEIVPGESRRIRDAEVPQFRRVEIDQVGRDLQIQFAVDHARTDQLGYGPMKAGGWSFQLFLDTDQKPTGYWLGYDYLTRDAESDLDGRSIRVRRTTALGAPSADGWGEETAVVPVHVNRATLSFRVPLEAVTDEDGRIDFALEIYRTTACDACPSGRSYDYVYSLFGSSDPHGRSLSVRRDGHEGHFARIATAPLP